MGPLRPPSRTVSAFLLLLGLVAFAAPLGPGAAPAPASGARSPSAKFSTHTKRALSKIVRDDMKANRVPGVNVGIWVPGRGRFVRSFGMANRHTGNRMDVRDHVRIASITKTFTGMATLRLVDQGRLRLGDRLSQFVKGVPNGRQITIRQVLGMTAGIYNFTEDPHFDARFTRHPRLPFPLRKVIGIIRRHGPEYPPGKKAVYSDSNYVLLGRVIKKVTGHVPGVVIRHQVIDRLHLQDTIFPTGGAIPRPRARGYFAGNLGKGPLRDYTPLNPRVPGTAGAMISTLGDLKTWAKALATGSLLTRSTHQKQLHFRSLPNSPDSPVKIAYGLGIFRLQDFLGHNGAIFGYNTSVFYLPRARATIVVEANKSTNASEESLAIFADLAKRLFPSEFPSR
jgi:D-alanyl-D-alanine carboxypeptidase